MGEQQLVDQDTADERPFGISRRNLVRVRRVLRGFLSLRWVPMAGALVALPLSAAALWLSLQQPEVLLIMPDQVRVAQGGQSGSAYVYLQPAFVNTGSNNRVEVIRDMWLEVRAGVEAPVTFDWDQQLRLVGDATSGGLSYEYAGDAVPMPVSPSSASAPLSLFDAPDGWHFSAGEYTFALVAQRVVTGSVLRDEFTVTLSEDDMTFFERPGPEQFLTFAIE